MRRRGWKLGFFLVGALGGCGGAALLIPFIGPASQVYRVKVSPGAVTLGPGESVILSASGYSILGNKVPTGSVLWSAQGDVSLLENGTIRPLGSQAEVRVQREIPRGGTVVVSAVADGKSGSASVTIDPQAVARKTVVVYPPVAGLTPGFRQRFIAVVLGAGGKAESNPSVTWSVSGDIGTIDEEGFLTAANVSAQREGKVRAALGSGEFGEADVIVRPAIEGTGEPVQLSVFPERVRLGTRSQLRFIAVAVDKEGDPVPLEGITWAVSDRNLGSIDAEGVLSTLTATGSFSVTAVLRWAQGMLTDSAQVEVVQ